MDKGFWTSISNNGYKIPEGYTLENLTEILFGYLGSTDPELRDEIAYTTYANWLKQELYPRDSIKSHIDTLLSELEKGIGETESDTVFRRAFSVLLLAEIVHNDNKKPLLERAQIKKILEKGIWYLGAEKDPRGHIQIKGWAHALAHTADLLLVLARNRNIDQADLWSILATASNKIVHSTNHVYIHGEDERLASAVLEIFKRDLISLNQLQAWTSSLAEPDGRDWKGVYVEEERNRAYQNTRNLLRSIYLAIVSRQEEIPDGDEIARLLLNALNEIRRY
jgi:hypothetical protein